MIALAIALLQNVLVAFRWHRVIEICGATLAPMAAVRFNLIGSFFSQVLPATVGGDAARIVLLARQGAGWWKATCSVLLDRFVGLLVLALLVTVALPWSFQLIGDPIGQTWSAGHRLGQHRRSRLLPGTGLCPDASAMEMDADAG